MGPVNLEWALGDAIDINVKERGTIKFRPLVTLNNQDNRVIELYNRDPSVYYRGSDSIQNIPPYDTPCWGFCGAEQFVTPGRSLLGLSDRECAFTPFSVDNALISEWNFLRSAPQWTYQVSGRTYTITRTNNEGVFVQRSADGRQVRQVLRIPNDEAKRIIIQRGILGAIPPNIQPLITPLLRPQGFPVAEYDKLRYLPPGYEEVATQGVLLNDSYGILSVSEALAILSYYSGGENKDKYPFSEGINIKF